MAGAGSAMQSWLQLWNEWEIQVVVVASFILQVILFFCAGIRRYNVSLVLKVLLWLVYVLADAVALYALGHMSSSISRKSSDEHQMVAFWAPFLLLHLGGQDTITAYALEDNELWLRHLLNMFVQVAGTAYVLYKFIIVDGATFVPAAMLVLAAGFVKYGERIWALKFATKKVSINRVPLPANSRYKAPYFLLRIWNCFCRIFRRIRSLFVSTRNEVWLLDAKDCLTFTENKQFGIHAFILMRAHESCHLLVKLLFRDRNIDGYESSVREVLMGHIQGYQREDDKSEDASAQEKRHIGELYKAVEVELALVYDMLYTKAQVIHTWYGYCVRAISLVCCFVSLMLFTKSKRDGYSTPNIVITFALLGGACTLEMASVIKAIGSTWTCALLRSSRWYWLSNSILLARYHLIIVKDGRWSDSVGQFNFITFAVHSRKVGLKGSIADFLGLKDLLDKSHCTQHAKLSPATKEFVWGLIKGDKSDMIQIEDVAIQSGYWARRFRGFDQCEELDWSMSLEFQESVLLWHIATCTFLNHPSVKRKLVDKDMAEEVNTLSDYMMYLIIEHPDILPVKAAARYMFQESCNSYAVCSGLQYPFLEICNAYVLSSGGDPEVYKPYKIILGYMKYCGDLRETDWDQYSGNAVLLKASTLVHTMLDMKLELTHKMAIIGTVWMEMLCYTATNATGEFHARQVSNGGEFLSHILLLTKYAAVPPFMKAADETMGTSAKAADETVGTSAKAADETVGTSAKAADETVGTSAKAADETVGTSAAGHVTLNVDNCSKDEITEIL